MSKSLIDAIEETYEKINEQAASSIEIEAPERAHVLIAKFGADTAERLAAELRFMADQIDREQLSTGCSGSPSGGAIYSYKVRPEQTHDAYFEQVDAWLAEQKRKRKP